MAEPRKIPKSLIAHIPDFAAAVQKHIDDMTAWRKHMANVGRDPHSYEPYPAPQASPQIVSAIEPDGDSYVSNFVVFNDDPAPELVLRAKKNALLVRATQLEADAVVAVLAPGKRRLYSMRHADIAASDSKVRQKVAQEANEKILEKLSKIPEKKRSDPVVIADVYASGPNEEVLEAEVASRRSPEDAQFVNEQDARTQRYDALGRHFAQVMHDIEDLTVENVDDWKFPPPPE